MKVKSALDKQVPILYEKTETHEYKLKGMFEYYFGKYFICKAVIYSYE